LVDFADIFPFAVSEVKVVFASMPASDDLPRSHQPKIIFLLVNEFLFLDGILPYHL